MVRLVSVDKGNWMKVLNLKVRADQKGFVAENSMSLAQAYIFPECVPLAIIDGDEPVGFCMYTIDDADLSYWILRLMVDETRQSMGYGRRAMELLLERIMEDRARHIIHLSFEPENSLARALYESMGFVSDNRIEGGEEVYKLTY